MMLPDSPTPDRVRRAIIDAALVELREHGEITNMAAVATRAGVSRATVYNHCASREELLRAMTLAAIDAVEAQLRGADLDRVDVPEAIARLSRALVTCGTEYAVTMTRPQDTEHEETVARVWAPVAAVLARGLADGTLDPRFSAEQLASAYWGLISGSLRLTAEGEAGVETAAALATSVFLGGTRRADLR
jgi:AcrR family transcriptional regulator